ncbi:unnamed protein product [Peronospora destructor]|uniref:Putative auto-transporter adhesin head GIN domain-containing protein n=1 Tax=Peronospora destructor TaxID=86335 RepID=A0AAV0UFS8_9STRA|nr:unnamed protein product [Peronospora destructor]
MKLSACVTAMAMALGATHAWTFNVSNVTSHENNVDEHQSLQRVWTISSFAQLQQLYLAIPGPVFVELNPSLLPPTDAEAPASEESDTEAPDAPGVVPRTTPGVIPGVVPGSEPGFVPGTVPPASGKIPLLTYRVSSHAQLRVLFPVSSRALSPDLYRARLLGLSPVSCQASSLDLYQVRSHRSVGLGWLDDSTLAAGTIEIPTTILRKHRRHHKDEDEEQSQGEETIVAKIVITGDSLDLLNMIEAAPLHPRRNDGLKIHLKNENANAEGYVMTQIYLYEKNLLRRVTTAFSGDVVLNDGVVTLDDVEADVNFACVGDSNMYLKSGSNVTLNSLEIEVTGDGLVQLEIPSVRFNANLDVKVAGSGSVAFITDSLLADEIKCTLSGSGNVVVDTKNLTAQKLDASVYGSGVASIATAGSVDNESLNLSGSGQLLAGSIVAATSKVDVWGNGEVLVQVTDKLTVSTSVWGKVGYVNAPPTEVKIKGWWFWRDANTIVYPAAVNKVAIYEPVAVPAKLPAYYSVETSKSALSDDPNYAFVSAEQSNVTELMTTSLSNVQQQTDATSTTSHGLFYAFIGVGVVVVNVVAARSWAGRRVRGHYTRLL